MVLKWMQYRRITPTAFEEANGSGSGTYQDIGGLAGEMGIGVNLVTKRSISVSGTILPKVTVAESCR